MTLNRGIRTWWLLAGLLTATPLWSNSISLSGCQTQILAGGTVTCNVNLAFDAGVSIDFLSFSASVTANGGAPAATGIAFAPNASGPSAFNGPTSGGGFGSVNLSGNVTIGTFTFTVPAGAAGGQSYTANFTNAQGSKGGNNVNIDFTATSTTSVIGVLTITAPVTGSALHGATVGAPYSQTITTSGGTNPLTFSISGWPAGFSIDSTGKITGTPAAAANLTNLGVTVKDNGAPQQTANATYSLAVAAGLSVAPASGAVLPSGNINVAYPGQTFTVTGGLAPFTWSVTSNNLPNGMALNPNNPTTTASLAGTPTVTANAITITVKVTDANAASVSGNYTLTINGPLSFNTTSPLPTATVNALYSTTLNASGGTPSYTWSNPSNNLPGGLTLNVNTGVISGTPTTAGPFAGIQLKVTDSANSSITNTYTMTVNPALVVTGPATIPGGTVGAAYPAAITATATGGSGAGTYTWSATGLPAGLAINPNSGTISGTPTASGTVTVTVTATDANHVTASKVYNNVVFAAALTITGPAALNGATVSTPYTATITTSGGTTPFQWNAGGLPANLTISQAGVISGSPAATGGPVNVTVTVTDAAGATTNRVYSLTVNPLPSVTGPASLPIATVNFAYTPTTVTSTGGSGNITWSAVGLPPGLTIAAATGVISGTATSNAGSPYSATVTATDINGATANKVYSITVNPALVITGPAALPLGIPNVVYANTTVTATGGSGAGYTWSATGLPNGLTINANTGVISGTPTTNAGSPFAVVVTVTDSINVKSTKNYSLIVAPPLTISAPSNIPSATVNVQYAGATFTAAGGSNSYSFSATGLPPGLSINAATGLLSGIPSNNVGTPFNVQVTVTDTNGSTAKTSFSLAVGALPLVLTGGQPPTALVNVPYSFTGISATGGIGAYTFTASGLPPGLTMDTSGNISGTPTTATGSPFNVTVTVTDAALNPVSKIFQLTVSGALTVAAPATLPAATLNGPYSATVTAGGGIGPFTWAATGLPSGLSIVQATGVITGTPTTNSGSPYSVTVTVTDSTGKTANKAYSLTVNTGVVISGPASLPVGMVSVNYTPTTITAAGGSGSYSWSATGLPAGLSIGASTGTITGTPTTSTGSPFTVLVSVKDSSGNTATQSFSLTINPAVSTLPVVSGVSNGAGGQVPVAANTYVAIYGSNFEPANFTDDWSKSIVNGALPVKLDGASVTFGATPVYVEYVSATQINVLLGNIGLGTMPVVVTTAAGSSVAFNATVQQYSPAFFPWPGGQAVASHLDGTLAAGPGTFPTTTTVAAKPGETIILWGTGFGPTTPAYPVGTAVPSTATYVTTSNVTASINSAPATVINNNAILTSGLAGTYQIAVTVPAGLANGSYTVTATINGSTTPAATLVVHN